ncbi:MAG TPA: M28 family peptidase [Terriglobales bacterium]
MSSRLVPRKRILVAVALFVSSVLGLVGQDKAADSRICEKCLQKTVYYLADDLLQGRGSATADELTAARYIADIFKNLGLEPVEGNEYILPVTLRRKKFTSPPQMRFTVNGKQTVWTHGKQMIALTLTAPEIKGNLVHAKADGSAVANIPKGSVVVISDVPELDAHRVLAPLLESDASVLIFSANGPFKYKWNGYARRRAELPWQIESEPPERHRVALIAVKAKDIAALVKAPDGTEITLGGPTKDDNRQTRNVIGVLPGSDPNLKSEVVMFSAHMDHLGHCAKTLDTICNGANDDASGTATVLELARIFSKGSRPKRTVVFTTYGSEEIGLLGSRAFAAEPPFPLTRIVADIEFEQTGLPEASGTEKQFWMTGSQLSDLKYLLQQNGSRLGDDPYPGNPFFSRSDNYSMASRGVVAHTLCGAAEYPDYHKPGDDANKLDYEFMATSIQQLLPGLEWLVNTDVKPRYGPGKNPAEQH